MDKIIKSDTDWRAQLSDLAYKVTRKHGTERAFTHDDFPESAPARFAASAAMRPCSMRAPSSIRAPGGPVSMRRSPMRRWESAKTTAFSRAAQRCIATAARRILATCSPMARRPPACAIA